MRKLVYDRVIILSAELTSNTYEGNRQLSDNLESCLDDLGVTYNKGVGSYKHAIETCFVVMNTIYLGKCFVCT